MMINSTTTRKSSTLVEDENGPMFISLHHRHPWVQPVPTSAVPGILSACVRFYVPAASSALLPSASRFVLPPTPGYPPPSPYHPFHAYPPSQMHPPTMAPHDNPTPRELAEWREYQARKMSGTIPLLLHLRFVHYSFACIFGF